MSTFDIILRIALWFIIGFFVAYKRDWYAHLKGGPEEVSPIFARNITILFGPISLIIAITKEVLVDKWNNT